MLQSILLSFALLVCLTPLAFYMCWLSMVHKKDRPTVVHGAWDGVGAVAACGGFLLIGGFILLSILNSDPRLFLRGSIKELQEMWAAQHLVWLLVLVGYIAAIAGAILITVRGRSHELSVYNIDAEAAGGAIEEALDRAVIQATRRGNQWVAGKSIVRLKPFLGLNHASISIESPSPNERDDVERHLRMSLAGAAGASVSIAGWFSAIATGLVMTLVGAVGILCYLIFFGR